MGSTLNQFIASLPQEERDQIEVRYRVLREEYLILLQSTGYALGTNSDCHTNDSIGPPASHSTDNH